jgi:hypothetical protein
MKNYNLIANRLIEMGSEIFHNNPVLRLSSFPTESEISKGNLDKIKTQKKQQLWINCECYDYDIKIDTTFDILFKHSDVKEYKKIKADIKYIAIKNDGTQSQILPRGYFALCLIEFDTIPDMLSYLRYSDKVMNKEENDILFLTQKLVLDKILELYKEGE